MAARAVLLALLVTASSLSTCSASGYFQGTKSLYDIFRSFTELNGFAAPAVIVKYESSEDSSVALAQLGNAELNVFERPFFYDNVTINNPLGGRAMVLAYNIPELAGAGPNLAIDGALLAAILVGNVTRWNDPALRQLNPTLAASLPDRNITFGYVDRCRMSSCDVFKNSLVRFSLAFAAEFSSRGRLFANMRFAAEGRGRELSQSSPDRAAWLQAEPYGLTFLDHDDAVKAGRPVRFMAMYNKAGALVEASARSVQLAMRDFEDAHAAGNFTADIYDPPGNGSWPLSYKLFITTHVGRDRSWHIGAILSSFCWAPSSSSATTWWTKAEDLRPAQLVPLDPSLRKHVVATLATMWRDRMQHILRPGDYLVGYGATLRWVASLTYFWRFNQALGEYLHTTSSEGIDRLVDRSGDFAVSVLGVERQRYEQMPDLTVMPLGVFSLVPACNIYLNSGQLVLDLPTIAAIYLGEITNWNDSRIRALNDEAICGQLPDAEIRVVIDDVESDTNELLTGLLSSKVPAFANAVGVSRRPKFPVMVSNATVLSDAPFEVSRVLKGTQHSFAVWYGGGIDTQFPFGVSSWPHLQVQHVAGIKSKGGTVVFSNTGSMREALDESAGSSASWAEASMLDVSGPGSWPMTAVAKVLYRRSPMPDCIAPALLDFLRWVYTKPTAEEEDVVLASSNAWLKLLVLDQIACRSNPTSTTTADPVDVATILAFTLSPTLLLLLLLLACLLLAYMRRGEAQRPMTWDHRNNIQLHYPLCEGRHQGNVHFGKWRDREVAIKVIKGNRLPVKVFRKEVNARATLLHPNIVPVLAACTSSPRELYIVMEYMKFGSVYAFLHNELIVHIPFHVRLRMAADAAHGMHFVHSSGLAHMGLTSHNLMLTATGRVRLSGVGLTELKIFLRDSGQVDDGDRLRAWVAPELLDGRSPDISPAADVYSFGIILWELLSREDPLGLTESISNGHLPILGDRVPDRYLHLLKQCCNLQPRERPSFYTIQIQLALLRHYW